MSLKAAEAGDNRPGSVPGQLGMSIIEAMVIDMDEVQVRTLEQVRQVVAGIQPLAFRCPADDEGRYGWIEQVLRRFSYRQLSRVDKGAVLAYLQRLSGCSDAQVRGWCPGGWRPSRW